MSNQGKELYEFGPFRLDPGKRLLLRDNQPVPLQPKAFETLLALVRTSEQVVLKDDLMKIVWPDTFVEESNLAQNVFVLRKALGDTVGDHKYILTIPGRGYRFAEKVRIIASEDTLAVESHSLTRVVIEESRPRRISPALMTGLVVLLGLGALAAYRSYRPQQGGQPASALPALAIRPRRSVAVLGFQNLSGSSDPAWLSTAFAEMLTTELGAGDQLRMVSSEEVAHLKTSLSAASGGTLSKDTLARIHQDLGADVVVLGSYSDLGKQSRGKIRLDLKVQDTAAGETVSTFSETGTEEELFQLVSRAGTHLREKLAVPAISGEQVAGIQASLPSNTGAERLYAEGLEKLRHYDALAAKDLLEQAIHSDPAYALAHSALAEALSQLGYETNASAEAKRAFELSDKLAHKDHLFIEANYRKMNREWDKAVDLYRTLFEFFPDDIEYGLRLADAQTQGGKRSDAQSTIQQLRQLPPPARDDVRIDIAEEMNYIRMGEYSKAREIAVRTVDKARATGLDQPLARALYLEAASLAPLGEGDKALAAAEEAKKIYATVGDQWGVSNCLEYLAYVRQTRGEWDQAQAIFQQALAVNRKIGNKMGAAIDLNSLSAGLENGGDIAGGKKLAEQAVAIYREIGDRNREADALVSVAWAVDAEDDPAAALQLEDQALAIYRDMSDERGTAVALDQKTSELILLGRLAEAQQTCQQSLDLARKSGAKRSIIGALVYLGHIAKLEGRLEDARKKFSEALATDRSDNEMNGETDLGLAEISEEEGKSAEARQHAKDSLTELHDQKDPADEISAQSFLAELALREGNKDEAARALAAARAMLPQTQGREEHYVFDMTNARLEAANGKFADARAALNSVIAETTKHGNVRYQLEARLALCEVEARTDPNSARTHAKALEKEASSRGFGLIAHKALAVGS